MFETFSIASLVDTARNYLTFRAGEIQLDPLDTCILILALSGALASALNLWRIARREDFQSVSMRCAEPGLPVQGRRARNARPGPSGSAPRSQQPLSSARPSSALCCPRSPRPASEGMAVWRACLPRKAAAP